MKLISMGLIAATAMIATPAGLVIVAGTNFLALTISRVPVKQLIKESRSIWILVGLIVLASILTQRDLADGATDGLIYGARLLLIFLSSQSIFATTTFEELRLAIARLLRPLPVSISWSAAAMVSLAIAFVPTPLAMADEFRIAAAARGLSAKQHPVKFIRTLSFSLVVRTLLEAESRRIAFELRCRTKPVAAKSISLSSWFIVSAAFFFCGVAVVI